MKAKRKAGRPRMYSDNSAKLRVVLPPDATDKVTRAAHRDGVSASQVVRTLVLRAIAAGLLK